MAESAFGVDHGDVSKAFRMGFGGSAAKKMRLAEHKAALKRVNSEDPFGGGPPKMKPKRPDAGPGNTRAPVPPQSASQATTGRNISAGQNRSPLGTRGGNMRYSPDRRRY